MPVSMQDKAVFVAASRTTGSGEIDSRLGTNASNASIDAEQRAYRLLTLAGYTIVIFTSDAVAICGECQGGTTNRDAAVRRNRPGSVNKQVMPFLQATAALRIDLSRSWMVSDRLDNIEVARLAGCKTILWTNGYETDWDMTPMRWPDLIACDLWEIACLIVNTGSMSVAEVPDEDTDQDD